MASFPRAKEAGETEKRRNKGGRPKGSSNLSSEQKRLRPGAVIDYTRWKNEFQKPADFYTYLAGYPDKTGLLATVYRLQPAIDVTLIGADETSILKTASEAEMTEDHVGAVFGRGKYMLMLNDGNRPNGQREVARTWFDLLSLAKAPVYDPRTLLLGNAKNVDEVNRLINIGVMVRDRATGQVRLKTEGDPVAPAAPASNGNIGSLDLGHVVAQLLTQQTRSPHDAVRDTIEMARLLAPVTPALDLETVVERVVLRLQGEGSAAPRDPFAIYNQVESFISKVRGNAAPVEVGKNGKKNLAQSWGPYMPGIFQELRGLLPELRDTFAALRSGAAAPAANGGGQQTMKREKSMQERIQEICVLGFQRMNEGVPGYDFAAYVCGFHPGGLEVFRYLDPNGPAGLIGLISMSADGAAFVNDAEMRPKVEAFLNDFFQFDASGLPGAPAGPVDPSPAAA